MVDENIIINMKVLMMIAVLLGSPSRARDGRDGRDDVKTERRDIFPIFIDVVRGATPVARRRVTRIFHAF
jgi:hypothetical protein